MPEFTFIEQYDSLRLGQELAGLPSGQVVVVESPRRLIRLQSYGFLHALWWLWLEDGRSVVSVPPGAGAEVRGLLKDITSDDSLFDPTLQVALREPVDAALHTAGLSATDRMLSDLCFACNGTMLRRSDCSDCRQLTDAAILPAEGLRLPEHCFPDGIAYGIIADGRVAAVAYAHRTGQLEDRVADIGVETAPAYRRRGFAKTVVSAVVAHIARQGGEARYACRPDNAASIATARSVGFGPYAQSLILSTSV